MGKFLDLGERGAQSGPSPGAVEVAAAVAVAAAVSSGAPGPQTMGGIKRLIRAGVQGAVC